MVRQRDFDISELGLMSYLRTLDLEDPPLIAPPVFPARDFRHSAIYINISSDIEGPQDLAGKTVGEFGTYGNDAGSWPKGVLSDEYGMTPAVAMRRFSEPFAHLELGSRSLSA